MKTLSTQIQTFETENSPTVPKIPPKLHRKPLGKIILLSENIIADVNVIEKSSIETKRLSTQPSICSITLPPLHHLSWLSNPQQCKEYEIEILSNLLQAEVILFALHYF